MGLMLIGSVNGYRGSIFFLFAVYHFASSDISGGFFIGSDGGPKPVPPHRGHSTTEAGSGIP
jgi:hypothetical protein